jgi:hypothetical protein
MLYIYNDVSGKLIKFNPEEEDETRRPINEDPDLSEVEIEKLFTVEEDK